MRPFLTASAISVFAAFGLAACATTSAPATSWGKPGVTLTQYWTDSSECALEGATAQARAESGDLEASGTSDYGRAGNAAGGASQGGANDLAPVGAHGDEVRVDVGGAVERQRYAEAQRQLFIQQAQQNAVSSCLTTRGYSQFTLTAEQDAHLKTLPAGSAERRAYLHSLASAR